MPADNAHRPGGGNFTISFIADASADSCTSNDINKSPTLTTATVPYALTCFNVPDLFNRTSDSGIQNDTSRSTTDLGPGPHAPQYISYLLSNKDAFDASSNYSRIWYQLVNFTGDGNKEGKIATLDLWIYPSKNCITSADLTEPWYQSSCQTANGGNCQQIPYSVQSFALAPTGGDDKCHDWQSYVGAAARLGQGILMLACMMAGLTTYHLIF